MPRQSEIAGDGSALAARPEPPNRRCSRAQLALDVEQAGGAPFVNAKLKKKSAVLLFSCTADAEDLVHGVGDSCDKFTASIVPPPNAGSPK